MRRPTMTAPRAVRRTAPEETSLAILASWDHFLSTKRSVATSTAVLASSVVRIQDIVKIRINHSVLEMAKKNPDPTTITVKTR